MSRKAYLSISGSIFGLVALLHLLRVIYGFRFQVGPFQPPLWASWGGLIIAGLLCVWAFRLLAKE